MPRTIDEAFRDFLSRLTPTSTESEGAKSHRASIESRLKNSFGLKRFTRIGSFGNGTSISGYSDVDYLAVLPTDQLTRDSSYTLSKVRSDLQDRFQFSDVRVSCPAVRIPFGTVASETTEVVVADYVRESNSYSVYDIADCAGGWMKASPDAHNDYVRSVDGKLGGKVKPLIRFLKAWKYLRDVPISSFYLELRVTKYADGEKSIIYEYDVKRVLADLWKGELADMQDPMGISGYIPACRTTALHDDALSKLETALSRAEKAREASDKGKIDDAFYWWRLLFNNEFPTYYY